jgi:hypothetical protein
MQDDPSLRAFVEAEIARAGISSDTARYNEAHWHAVALALGEKVESLQKQIATLERRKV